MTETQTSPMAVNPPRQYAFCLTEKSVEVGRDTFIFTNGKKRESQKILIGLNQTVTQASTRTLLRWVKLFDMRLDAAKIKLLPVRMEKSPIAPFAVHVEKSSVGPPLDLTHEPIPAGEYVWTGRRLSVLPAPSLAKLKDRYDNDPKLQEYVGDNIELYKFPDGWKDIVSKRDENKCFMTGRESTKSDPLELWWIFPPTWGYWLERNSQPATHNTQIYLDTDNAIFLDKKLIPDFHDNAIGVDVADNRRIIQFRDLKSDIKLPSHLLPRPAGSYSHIDAFLHMHFRFCIQACVFGGDIHEQTRGKIPDLMYRLGVRVETGEHELVREDSEWLSVMGKGILDMLVMQEAITEEEAKTFGVPVR